MALTVCCILRGRNIGAVSNLGVRSSCEKCVSVAVIVIISSIMSHIVHKHHVSMIGFVRILINLAFTQ